MTGILTPKPNSRLGFSCGLLFPHKTLIQVLKDLEEFCSWLNDWVEEDGSVIVCLHCNPSVEDSFFPYPDDVKNISFLENYGFKRFNSLFRALASSFPSEVLTLPSHSQTIS